MKEKSKKTSILHTDHHNAFFKSVITTKRYNLEFLKLILPAKLFAAFDWETLRPEACTYLNKDGKERRTDLVLSARFKESEGSAKVIFLVEHKAQKRPEGVLLQLLDYQNAIYQQNKSTLNPIIPIIIYQGKVKSYSGPVKLHDILKIPRGEMGEFLKRFVLDFECFLLNVHDLDMEENSDLTLAPILYIMQSIFNLDREVVKKLFAQGRHLSENEWGRQIMMVMDYVSRVDSRFNWERLKEIAKEEEGEETVTFLEKTLDEMISDGRAEGLEEGIEKGIEKGRKEGRREVARNLLIVGTDPKTVAKATGLTLQEVKELNSKA